ncbi:vWA domain-containing protein [Sporohalobacter salinus]|uniref:vWA domain-containing protein n=1 Tax=Sporohalobacter salinus TaxID=1494606 RepID=UPI001960EE3C|nr:VWA domain-containing protein [Sporohalobacter salinus]MBM7624498.1 Ca-activated chloride channel family protein [Sporohalobacter salinus]
MKLKHNVTLLTIILIFLLAIIGITELPFNQSREIKVDQRQLPTFINASNVEIIWDVSGSMWGEVKKNRKYLRAKEVLTGVVESIPSHVNIGLRIFGTEEFSDSSTSLAVNVSQNNKSSLLEKINNLKPAGKSPIGKALSQAGIDLINLNGNNHILLVTDGRDTGNIVPNRVARRLHKNGIYVHVLQIGKANDKEKEVLKSVANLGGGKYFTYSDRHAVVSTMNLVNNKGD